jgi:N-methylhydantoinase A
VVPVNAAVFSAWGMLMTDLRRDLVRTRVVALDAAEAGAIGATYDELAAEVAALFAADDVEAGRLAVIRYADIRYTGQEHSVKVEFPGGTIDAALIERAAEAFHVAHEREYSFRLVAPVELVNFHVAGLLAVDKPGLPRIGAGGRDAADAARGRRRVDFAEDGVHDTPIYRRERLPAGFSLAGPVVIEEEATTIVVPPGARAVLDEFGNVEITINGQGS